MDVLKTSTELLNRHDVDWVIEIMINDEDKYEVFDIMKNYGYNGYLITNSGLVRENRPLTLPYHNRNNRTCWKNHYFTQKNIDDIKEFSLKEFGYWV